MKNWLMLGSFALGLLLCEMASAQTSPSATVFPETSVRTEQVPGEHFDGIGFGTCNGHPTKNYVFRVVYTRHNPGAGSPSAMKIATQTIDAGTTGTVIQTGTDDGNYIHLGRYNFKVTVEYYDDNLDLILLKTATTHVDIEEEGSGP